VNIVQNEKKKKFIKKRYDSNSYIEIYDNRYKSIQNRKILSLLHEFDFIDGFILDYGAGTGLLYEFLCKTEYSNTNDQINIFKLRYLGIDLSLGMLNKFKSKLKESDKKYVHLLCCDGENLPIRPSIFDNSFALTTLQNLPNLEKGLEEIKRTSKSSAIHRISFLKKSKDIKELKSIISHIFSKCNFIKPISQNNELTGQRKNEIEDWLIIAQD